jgi:hypothetical protein
MKMIKDNVDFSKVYYEFFREHIGSHGFAPANREIKSANKELKKWQLVELDLEEICEKILLVNHRHPSSGMELIPAAGMTIPIALENFRNLLTMEYSVNNKDCYDRIVAKSKTEFTTIFLSGKPISTIPEHQKLLYKPGNLIHLDGLHRLVGWAYAGKFSDAYTTNAKKLIAFIAGNLASK